MIASAFVACSSKNDSGKQTTSTTIPTEAAKIKERDAIDFIKTSYSKEELGLDKEKRAYRLMVASSGVDIEGKKYIKVVANVVVKNDVTEKDGKNTFTMDTVGEYYISFDGKTILKKDMKTNEYIELENRYSQYLNDTKTTKEAQKK